jgi:folate-dependent phosphoribosylglycinamide formyltransferase PurN
MTILPIHEPSNNMRTVVFASGSGTNFREAVLESRSEGSNFSIDLLLTDKEKKKEKRIGALGYADEFQVAAETVNGLAACGSWKVAQLTIEGRQEYERRCRLFNSSLLAKVQGYEQAHDMTFDFAVLAGYMRLFKGALLRRFNMRAINVHPAALYILNDDGERRYVGENAVYDALKSGERRTRSSIIMLDPETDAGAILASGPWVEYTGGPVTQDSADKHQDEQKIRSDWPALRFVLREIALGHFALHPRKHYRDGNPVAMYKGKELPYCGYDMAA